MTPGRVMVLSLFIALLYGVYQYIRFEVNPLNIYQIILWTKNAYKDTTRKRNQVELYFLNTALLIVLFQINTLNRFQVIFRTRRLKNGR